MQKNILSLGVVFAVAVGLISLAAQASSSRSFTDPQIIQFLMEKNAINWAVQPCYHFLVNTGSGTYCDGSALKANDGGAAATWFCNLAGYAKATPHGFGSWHSPHDNTLILAGGVTQNGATGGNSFIEGGLTCSEPLVQATPTPTATPTLTPTPTATPTAAADKPELTVTKTDGKTSVRPGGEITYTLTVRNESESERATIHDLKVTDTLPKHMQILTVSPHVSFAKDTDTIVWQGFILGPKSEKKFTITVRVKSDAPNGFRLVNEVVARSDDHDVTARAEDGDTRVQRMPAIAAVKVVQPVAVRVTAKTGAGATGLLITLTGLAGLALSLRKYIK